jgi:hypothetical protein
VAGAAGQPPLVPMGVWAGANRARFEGFGTAGHEVAAKWCDCRQGLFTRTPQGTSTAGANKVPDAPARANNSAGASTPTPFGKKTSWYSPPPRSGNECGDECFQGYSSF